MPQVRPRNQAPNVLGFVLLIGLIAGLSAMGWRSTNPGGRWLFLGLAAWLAFPLVLGVVYRWEIASRRRAPVVQATSSPPGVRIVGLRVTDALVRFWFASFLFPTVAIGILAAARGIWPGAAIVFAIAAPVSYLAGNDLFGRGNRGDLVLTPTVITQHWQRRESTLTWDASPLHLTVEATIDGRPIGVSLAELTYVVQALSAPNVRAVLTDPLAGPQLVKRYLPGHP